MATAISATAACRRISASRDRLEPYFATTSRSVAMPSIAPFASSMHRGDIARLHASPARDCVGEGDVALVDARLDLGTVLVGQRRVRVASNLIGRGRHKRRHHADLLLEAADVGMARPHADRSDLAAGRAVESAALRRQPVGGREAIGVGDGDDRLGFTRFEDRVARFGATPDVAAGRADGEDDGPNLGVGSRLANPIRQRVVIGAAVKAARRQRARHRQNDRRAVADRVRRLGRFARAAHRVGDAADRVGQHCLDRSARKPGCIAHSADEASMRSISSPCPGAPSRRPWRCPRRGCC
jgi:hypothetical protein